MRVTTAVLLLTIWANSLATAEDRKLRSPRYTPRSYSGGVLLAHRRLISTPRRLEGHGDVNATPPLVGRPKIDPVRVGQQRSNGKTSDLNIG
jgi:hypothetical protein